MENISPEFDLNLFIIERLKNIRSEMQLSQKQFADLLHISPSVINRMEKGRKELTLNFIQKISEKTPYSIGDILDIKGNIYHVENQKGLQNQCSNPSLHINLNNEQFEELKGIFK